MKTEQAMAEYAAAHTTAGGRSLTVSGIALDEAIVESLVSMF